VKDVSAVVTENVEVVKGLRRLILQIDAEFSVPLPGQFVNLRMGESLDPLLRRPFSVYSYTGGEPASLGILYAPVGRWTRKLALCPPGASISVLGPLGSAFKPGAEELSVLVAGGRGVAPMIYLAERLEESGRSFVALLGARGSDDLHVEGALEKSQVKITTEDGSTGARGIVTDLLEPELEACGGRAAVYCCGPVKMLRRISEICAKMGVPCQASVETVFACGVGVCRGCTVHTPAPEGPYLMACSDGPVLRSDEVDWESFAP
jgi:dihydroorotate dehydrogenase electron transfer subunit